MFQLLLVVYAILDTRQWWKTCENKKSLQNRLELSAKVMEATLEDQHSQHAPKENINAYRSMRDRMHPPRMSALSCIVPPVEQLVIRPHMCHFYLLSILWKVRIPTRILRNLKRFAIHSKEEFNRLDKAQAISFNFKGKGQVVDPQFCPSTLAFILLMSHPPIVRIWHY